MDRTYTGQIILTGSQTAGTVQLGAVIDSLGVPVNGLLVGCQLTFNPTMTGGTATLSSAGQGGPAGTLLSYVGGTSQWMYPQAVVQTTGGTATTFYQVQPVDDLVNLVVSGCSAGTITARAHFAQ
jgi:hypothetical protein